MQSNEEISALIQGLKDDYNNNTDISQIKQKITQINQLLAELEQDHYDNYEYLKYQQSEICVLIFERQNDQRSVSQYLKKKSDHLSGYQYYQNLKDKMKRNSQQTQGYEKLEMSNSQTCLDDTQPFFKQSNTEMLKGEDQVVNENLLLAFEIDLSSNNLIDQSQNEQEKDKQGITALIKLQNKQAETHELGILANGVGRIGIKGTVAALNIAKSVSCWSAIVVTTGVAAVEAVVLLKKYYKLKKECKDDGQRQIAKEILIKQLKALGIKTFSTFGITTGCIIGGSIVGSCVPGIGTFVGSLLGAIVGTILSFVSDSFLQNYILSEKKLIEECENDLGLGRYYKINKKKYTKEEFQQACKLKLLSLHPDRSVNFKDLQTLQRYELQKVQFAKEMIKQHNQWN
ncbi:DnaJ domain protein (macronuclear) [Tetrahymena thermophila SB210]|uniref:DnaJ domain protein n=1 Tax=Tetrahymena thermophila (strain SB210) TaxID=312017 RepID=Q22KI1_TETTS|nr:DnaJ domain protein [Tetrahymena thermophila SB210]EAR85818.1 DnaJ domain protein [Tetrahymena thermophila SB210]|eukprot:XP_001033481.1 DnaJ domain protein [Tetrahymena thermophila SB210]